MTNYKTIRVESDDPACIITLNRPERRNAISTELMDELIDAMQELDNDKAVRGVIITGGDDYFAAGADSMRRSKSRPPNRASITSAAGTASATRSKCRRSR